jgi:signal transduction histidine kinase
MAVDALRRFVRALRSSVRVRITSAAVGVVGAALFVGAIALVWSLHAVLTREALVTATVRAAEVARIVEAGGDAGGAVAGDDVVLQVFGPAGEVVAASPNAAGGWVLPRLPPGASRIVKVPFNDNAFVAVAAAADGGRTVVFAQALDSVEESTRALAVLLAIGLPALLLVVGATSWRVVGRALAPVDAIRAEVDSISAAQLHRRVPRPAASDEIGRFADTMNRMLDRLDRARSRERRFVADASHELRSPIAAIRQHAEVALAHPELSSDLARVAHAESLRMQALINDLLLLAQADAHTLPLRRRPVDLDDLVLAEATRLRDLDAPVIDTHGVSAARVDGDPAALSRVLGNLGDNAARHARGRIALAVSGQDGWAELHVDDDGSGVPAADRSRAFERFVRLDHARARSDGGSGLGLAIVAEIVTAHGGTAVIGDGPLGGARVTVRLPLITD